MAGTISAGYLKVLIWGLILLGLALSAGALYSGAATLLADRRIKAAGLTETARIVSLQQPTRAITYTRVRLGWVGYELLSQPGVRHELEISRDTWSTLRVGQTITIDIDPENPVMHQFDRARQIRLAWSFFGFGLLLLPCCLGLMIWALRGGMSVARAGG